jgi:hypothetical protein
MPQTGHVGRLRGIPPSVVVRSRDRRATAQTAITADALGLARGRRARCYGWPTISIVAPARLPSSPPTTTPSHSADPPDQRTDEHRPRPHRRLGILANGLAGDPPRARRGAGARPKEERCSHEQRNRRRCARQLDLGLPGRMEEKPGGAGRTRPPDVPRRTQFNAVRDPRSMILLVRPPRHVHRQKEPTRIWSKHAAYANAMRCGPSRFKPCF